MSDATFQPGPDGAAPWAPARPRSRFRRFSLHLLALVVALIAALVVTGLSIDLGPAVKSLAERQASKYINRPFHIGRLSAKLQPGVFVFENVVIEGLTPTDRPFLHAARITVTLPWWTMLRLKPELIIDDVHMTGWQMVIEKFADGRHNFPKFTHETKPGPKGFTKTVRGVFAEGGTFTFDDHGSPWSVVAPNLSVRIVRSLGEYRGTAQFAKGTVTMQSFVPMSADMQTQFRLDGTLCQLEHINLITDGAESQVHGIADLAHWPVQQYEVSSRVHFPRMRQIFFAGSSFELIGDGTFKGTFRMFKDGLKDERELKGDFASDLTGIDTAFGNYRLPNLTGSLTWLSGSFEVHTAKSDFYGGRLTQHYLLAPLGTGRPAMASWETAYEHVDLHQLSAGLGWPVLRLDGIASGENAVVWPNGHWHDRDGTGVIRATATDGGPMATRALPAVVPVIAPPPLPPGTPVPLLPAQLPFPAAGEIHYHLGPDVLTVADGSWAATRSTFVALSGTTAYGDRSEMPFHLTSTNWQESDQLFAAIMSAFHAPTGPIEVGGYGVFDGTMQDAFKAPRITGRFSSPKIRAWGVTWGRADGDLVILNNFADVTSGVVTGAAQSRILADGHFSLRRDGSDDTNARVRVQAWPASDLRTAFDLQDYPVEGATSADIHLYGPYKTLEGFGHLHFDDATAWGEAFQSADGTLALEGTGVQINDVEMHKSTGTVRGAAHIGWDGSYSFSADGAKIPVESFTRLTIPNVKLTGLLTFTAFGSGLFASPHYHIDGDVPDLYAGDEGIGPLSGSIDVADNAMTVNVNASTSRLNVSGNGRISLATGFEGDMTFNLTDSSIDPYLRLRLPKWPSDASVRASGRVHVFGGFDDLSHVKVDGTVDDATLTLFHYMLRNDGPVLFTMRNETIDVSRMWLTGEETQLRLNGTVSLADRQVNAEASGDVDLAILQLFSSDIVSSGAVKMSASAVGGWEEPVFAGNASITDGRFRHLPSMPQAIDQINGTISFDKDVVRLDDLRGRIGGGGVIFGGYVGLTGFMPDEFNVTADGTNMHLRYPEGFDSYVNAHLSLRNSVKAPFLGGTVTVQNATLTRRLESSSGLLSFLTTGEPGAAEPALEPIDLSPSPFPLTMEVRVVAGPGAIRVNDQIAHVTAHANLVFSGTFQKVIANGSVEIDRGDVLFEGNRYTVRTGRIEFNNPNANIPFFDVEADTPVRAPGQTYLVHVHVSGTKDHFSPPEVTSEPALPYIDVLSLLFGNPDTGRAEINNVGSPQEEQLALLGSASARFLAAPLSATVGQVLAPIGLDAVQVSPLLSTDPQSQQINPGARLMLGKRISDRAFLTYSRDLNSGQSEVIVLEFDQNDRISWVVSRNEDLSFSLDFRVRHIF